jgi:hypothetical protein
VEQLLVPHVLHEPQVEVVAQPVSMPQRKLAAKTP